MIVLGMDPLAFISQTTTTTTSTTLFPAAPGAAMSRLAGPDLGAMMQCQMQQMMQLEMLLLSMLTGLMGQSPRQVSPLGHASPLGGGPLPQGYNQPGGKSSFNIASFNVLGSSHTAAGGNKPGMASGVERMRGAVAAMKKNDVDIAGLQEFQGDQQKAFRKLAPGYGMAGEGDNAIVWNKSRFQLVEKREFTIPYFEGHPRKMPVVLLQDKQSGKRMWVVNVHNPADTKAHPHNAANRARAINIEQNLLQQLQATGLPVIFLGDLNDRSTQGDMRQAGMSAALPNGAKSPVDWIYGSRGVQFSNYTADRSVLHGTSDHALVVSQATI